MNQGSGRSGQQQQHQQQQHQQQGMQRHSDVGGAGRQQQGPHPGSGIQRRDYAGDPMGAMMSGAVTPFAMMRRMMDDMDRLFENFGMGRGMMMPSLERLGFGESSRPLSSGAMESTSLTPIRVGTWVPDIEVAEHEGKLVVTADLPGLTKDDVTIEVRDTMLVLRGVRRQERREEMHGVFHSERSYGSFQRVVALPQAVDPADIDASFEEGVLRVVVPIPQSQSRRIEIKSGGAVGRSQPSRQAQSSSQYDVSNGPAATAAR